jgi:hypothetical protein
MAGFGVLQPIDNGSCPLGGSQDKSSWDLLKDAMHDRVQELKRFTQLRVDGKHLLLGCLGPNPTNSAQ